MSAGPVAAVGSGPPPAGASPSPQAERRLVSVLFCDLVGFTSASEARDAEQTREILSAYYELARERVELYGGAIEKFIGDAVMAVWGVPVAHEDDAERAVRAALELVAAVPGLGGDLGARAAVATGEAAVTLGAEGQGMVAGDLVNTASRLQGIAGAGHVLVTDATHAATERAVVYERLGSTELRGKSDTVEVWRATRARAGIGGRFASDELEPPFVGRDTELRMLTEMFHATARERRLRLASVTGQAGIGKSRLSRELEAYLDGIRQTVFWLRGRCPAYGDGLTYWALGEMVRQRAGIAETDGPDQTSARITATLDEFVSDAAERARIEPALRALVGLDTRGWAAAETGELYAAWRLYFERIAERAPAVLVFEDMQWADAGLVGFIEHLLEWSRSQPMLVVTLARPEFLEQHPTWGAGLRNFSNLHLEPLPDDVIVALLDGVVPGLPSTAASAIAARAEGIPLYAVETLRMLLAQGVLARDGSSGQVTLVGDVSALAIPDSLRGLVSARLDLLPATERTLAQDAAVLGQTFTLDGLAAISGMDAPTLEPHLRELVRRELLRVESDPRSPERGQYQWVQAVLREVAYATLAKRDRRTRHLAAARYYDTLIGEESAGVVADHYLEAWRASTEPAEAAPLAAQARVALRAAAERAERLRNHIQAASYVGRSLELCEEPAERARLLERAGDLLSHGGATLKAEARYREALAALPSDADPDDVARISARIGREVIAQLRLGEAISVLEESVARLGADLDGPGRVELEQQLGRAYFLERRNEEAEAALQRTIAAAERVGPTESLVEAVISLGSLGLWDGSLSATAMLFGSVELARRLGLTRAELRALNNLSAWAGNVDPVDADALTARILEICDRTGFSPIGWLVTSLTTIARKEGMASAMARATDLAAMLEHGSREEDDLAMDRMVLAAWGGDWQTWEEVRQSVPTRLARSAETDEFWVELTGLGLLLQDREPEALEVFAGSEAERVQRLGVLVGLLRSDTDLVSAGLTSMSGPWAAVGTLQPGLRGVGEAGLRLLEGGTDADVDRYLDSLELLARTDDLDLWTLAVKALVRLVGAEAEGVLRAQRGLRTRLESIGADGLIESLDRELASAHERSPGGVDPGADGSRADDTPAGMGAAATGAVGSDGEA